MRLFANTQDNLIELTLEEIKAFNQLLHSKGVDAPSAPAEEDIEIAGSSQVRIQKTKRDVASYSYAEASKAPRVFISYSWESEDHKRWVRHLGEELCRVGVEARLDQWFIKPGESFTQFMEQEVEKADFVIAVCTPTYAQKSNNRHGGVGYEQQIVSGQLMAGTARTKFIPVIRLGNDLLGPDCAIPNHFLGIAWIEFRNDASFEVSLDDLVRVIFSKPKFAPPPLGSPPALPTSFRTEVHQQANSDSDYVAVSLRLPDGRYEKAVISLRMTSEGLINHIASQFNLGDPENFMLSFSPTGKNRPANDYMLSNGDIIFVIQKNS